MPRCLFLHIINDCHMLTKGENMMTIFKWYVLIENHDIYTLNTKTK